MLLSLTACAANRNPEDINDSRTFQVRDLAKSDIDTVAEMHVSENMRHLRTLMVKLYRRNPRELRKSGTASIDDRVNAVFDAEFRWVFPELRGKRGTDCVQLAFHEGFEGDRVLAFVVGLTSMVLSSYNNKTEFFLLDDLDPQKLYNSARNVEIAVWKLANDRNSRGELFLYSNSLADEQRNLSFERLFGKIIAQQDVMAVIVADKTNRRVRNLVQKLAGAVFLPI